MDKFSTLKILNSSKYNISEKKYIFLGTLSETILNKNLFKYNIDLKEYISLFEDVLDREPYKEYLYSTRPLLASQVVKDFVQVEPKNNLIIKEAIERHVKYMHERKYLDTQTKVKIPNKNNLLEDMIKGKTNER